ncbi:phosphatase domain-containing protein [Limibacter armeniacum]|uniref:phosphatase domain-containing protein n=1 Tax=Limibacter armeniacum TaxID=466084 RepID=UPI002FE63165
MSRKLVILPQTGLICKDSLCLEGQILRLKNKHLEVKKKDGIWRNINRLYKLYTIHKVSNTPICIQYLNQSCEVTTDSHGYFQLNFPVKVGHHFTSEDIQYSLLHGEEKIYIPEISQSDVYPIKEDSFGVISDIDDTILQTFATNLFKRLSTVLRYNALKRKEVKHMSDFYNLFSKRGGNFFYVSNSEMNLFLIIKLFLNNREFPDGPIYLKPFKRLKHLLWKKQSHHSRKNQHKLDRIRFLLNSAPLKPFVFVGDSGQNDPLIYYKIALEFPEQVKGIFIRGVKKYPPKNATEINRYKDILNEKGIPFYIFRDPHDMIPIAVNLLDHYLMIKKESPL